MVSSKQALEQAKPHAEALLQRLVALDYPALAVLPECDFEELAGYKKSVALTTYRDIQTDSAIQIVVQLMVKGWLGSARIWVEGFKRWPDGGFTRMKPEDLWDFR